MSVVLATTIFDMQVFSNVLDMVGRTPMLELGRIPTGPCRLFLKLELMNPGGSIKDRIGISMIEEAEKRGDMKPGATIVEATAGNTGIGLALVAAQKGYQLILVLPDKMSQEKIFNLRAMGAEVVLTRSDVGRGHPEYYQDLGRRIAEEKGAYFINQFGNPDNPLAHERTTGARNFRATRWQRGRDRPWCRLERHGERLEPLPAGALAANRDRDCRPGWLHRG